MFFYDQTLWSSPTTAANYFTILRELPINYLYILCKYYQTGEDGEVLGYPIQYYQHEINSISPQIKLSMWIVSWYLLPLLIYNYKLKITTVPQIAIRIIS